MTRSYVTIGRFWDNVTRSVIYGGIQIYPRLLAPLCYNFIRCSEYLCQTPELASLIGGSLTTRVESNLWRYFYHLGFGISVIDHTPLGWHGFEQHPGEVFRQYAVRRRRDPSLQSKSPWSRFLGKAVDEATLLPEEKLARLGWQNYELLQPTMPIGEVKSRIENFMLSQDLPAQEPLYMSLEQFREKYRSGLDQAHHDLNRVTPRKVLRAAKQWVRSKLGWKRCR